MSLIDRIHDLRQFPVRKGLFLGLVSAAAVVGTTAALADPGDGGRPAQSMMDAGMQETGDRSDIPEMMGDSSRMSEMMKMRDDSPEMSEMMKMMGDSGKTSDMMNAMGNGKTGQATGGDVMHGTGMGGGMMGDTQRGGDVMADQSTSMMERATRVGSMGGGITGN